MNLERALRQASRRLEEAGVAAPRLTAEVLLASLLERPRSFLYAHPEQELAAEVLERYRGLVEERARGKPTQYLTGRQEFYGREFVVTPDVMIPRPETEHVVEEALELAREAARVVDVGCGSGAIAITLSLETGRAICATDISTAALAVAAENASKLGARVHLIACDLVSALASQSMDMVVSNPPYVAEEEASSLPREVREYEPAAALFAGRDGLDLYRRLILEAARVLRPGGWLVLELGYRALDPVRAMLADRWCCLRVRQDLAGWPRVLAARLRVNAS